MGDHNVPFGKYGAPYFPADEMRRFAEKANDTKAVFIDGDFRYTIPYVMQLAYDAVIYCDPPYIPASKTANFTAYGKPFTSTITATWLQPCSMLIASTAPAR